MAKKVENHFKKTIKGVVALANYLLVALFVASAWGGVINPNTSVFPAGLTLMFPIFLILMILAFAATLIWFRRLAIVNLAALILCGGQVLNYCPLNFFRASEAEVAGRRGELLKVLSFNTYGFIPFGDKDFKGENPTMDYILNSNADIVLLQEADGLALNRISESQSKRLDEIYPHSTSTHRGMAIFSKYPFTDVPVEVKDKAQLDLCRYDVTLDSGRVVHLFNVHMQSIGLTAKDKKVYEEMTSGETPDDTESIRYGLLSKLAAAFRSRANQAEEIRNALNDVAGDVILAGDFNDVPGSYACQTVKGSDMIDAYRHSGLGPAITYHANRFYFRIDHVFYCGNLEAVRTQRGRCNSSDHYPLIVNFKLK